MSSVINKERCANSLANLFPNDPIFGSKFIDSSNFRKLLFGISFECSRVEEKMDTLSNEMDLFETEELLVEWERAWGIPDDCFQEVEALTREERINQVLAKIRGNGVSTEQQFIDIVTLLGGSIVIVRPTNFPRFRFVWIIEGDFNSNVPPYDLPYDFAVDENSIQCFLNKLKPANTVLIFEET